jgi:Xaa-Pro dipeptidase
MKGIGGKSPEQALSELSDMTKDIEGISKGEFEQRIAKAQSIMKENGQAAIYLNAGTNLYYFTGLDWYASERMVGAILPAFGDIQYIAPFFEVGSLQERMLIEGNMHTWQEEESPYELFHQILESLNISTGSAIGLCESAAYFMVSGIQKVNNEFAWFNAAEVTNACRKSKSAHEIALIQRAMDMTIEVHRATASMLYEGITTTEVEQFINEAHKRVGASGSYFVIVLFGEASQYPHGVKDPQTLKQGDIVLIDTGCKLKGYHSDITRTYVFGTPTERQKQVWQAEQNAQLAAFNAAQLGQECQKADEAARASLIADGFGPDYNLPGLPHRTGHGLGLDIHEGPYLVKGSTDLLQVGMVFSNEPMLVVPGEFGVRLEDHFYMTDSGPKWFTEPSESIENPLNLA